MGQGLLQTAGFSGVTIAPWLLDPGTNDSSPLWDADDTGNVTSFNFTDVQILYSSESERVLTIALVLVLALLCLAGQGAVLLTIATTTDTHEVENTVLVTNCLADLLVVVIAAPYYIGVLIANRTSMTACNVVSTLVSTVGVTIRLLIVLLGYERYVYFIRPLVYIHHLTVMRVWATAGGMALAAAVYSGAMHAGLGRTYHAATMYCDLPNSTAKLVVANVVWTFTPAALSGYFCYKIWRLSVSSQVAPALPSQQCTGQQGAGQQGTGQQGAGQQGVGQGAGQQGAFSRLPTIPPLQRRISKAVRMNLMVAGALYGTFLPAGVLKIVLIGSGVSEADMDARRGGAVTVWAALLLRLTGFAYTIIPPVINPAIYFYSRSTLRNRLRKTLGMAVPNAMLDYSLE